MERMEIAGDPRFFQRTGPHSLAAVVDAARAEAPPRRLMLTGIAPLHAAGPDEVSFLDNRKYLAALETTRAGAVIVHPNMVSRVPESAVPIVTAEPHAAWARAATLFFPVPPAKPGVHPAAVVAADAIVDPTAEIGPLAVIGAGARIGPRCRIAPLAVVGDGVVMGRDCRIGSHASLSHAMLGDRVAIYPGARIGQEGFGFAITPEGFISVPQLGRVVIEDDVEVGANSTIDRGSLRDTVIGAGTRLDNLVQIAHNVQLGRCCVVVAQVGISGSTTLEDFVMLGGQAGLTGHLRIGRGAKIAAQSGIMADVPAGAEYMGSPAEPIRSYLRGVATLRKQARRDTKKTESNQTGDSRSGSD
jgi:UDP-3-O-[3-hydroxymyristoyl] glucosamine N-acyltransferase